MTKNGHHLVRLSKALVGLKTVAEQECFLSGFRLACEIGSETLKEVARESRSVLEYQKPSSHA